MYFYANEAGSLDGEWERGQFVSGKWTLPNGNVFEGQFVNGKPTGPGVWSIDSDIVHGEYNEHFKWKFTLPVV